MDVASDYDTVGTYIFEVKRLQPSSLKNAVSFAQRQVLQEISKKSSYNVLLYEG